MEGFRMERKSTTEFKTKCFYTERQIDICKLLEKEILHFITKEITETCSQNTLFSDNKGL